MDVIIRLIVLVLFDLKYIFHSNATNELMHVYVYTTKTQYDH